MRNKFLVLATVATMALAGAAAPAFASGGTVTTVTCPTPLKTFTFAIDGSLPTSGTFATKIGPFTATVTFNADGTATVQVGSYTATCFVTTTTAAG